MTLGSVVAAASLAFTILVAQEVPSKAAEVKVLIFPGMSTVMEQLGSQFEGITGHKLLPLVGFDFQLKVPLDAGDFDVAINTTTTIDNLVKQGKVFADTRAEIARVGVGVAVKKGAPKPDISSAEAFKSVLLNVKSISYTKDSGTGKYLASLMERLGIAEEMKPKTKLMGGVVAKILGPSPRGRSNSGFHSSVTFYRLRVLNFSARSRPSCKSTPSLR